MGERDRRRVGFWIRSRDLFVAETGTLVNAHVAASRARRTAAGSDALLMQRATQALQAAEVGSAHAGDRVVAKAVASRLPRGQAKAIVG
jgi:hypothetical protein